MPLIANNIVIIQPVTPLVGRIDPVSKQFVTSEPKKEQINSETKYLEIKEGVLIKKYNKKSSYLSDMISIESD